LELLPQRLNSAKGDRVGSRQIALAKTLEQAGLLTGASVQKIQSASLRITQRQ
jgi:hypothetical protein